MTDHLADRNVFKAARLIILYDLGASQTPRRAGQLEGMTQQQIADLFEVGLSSVPSCILMQPLPSTALRDLRMLEAVKLLLPQIRQRLARERDIFFDDAAQAPPALISE